MSRQFLVDTHAVLWWLDDDRRLPAAARSLIADPANVIAVSAASLWEIAIKSSLNKLDAPSNLPQLISREGFAALAVEHEHAWACSELPLRSHKDPFDRMLAAQALREGFDVVSADASFEEYGIRRHWS